MNEPQCTGTKMCSGRECPVVGSQSVLAFSANPKALDGLRSQCKVCERKSNDARYRRRAKRAVRQPLQQSSFDP